MTDAPQTPPTPLERPFAPDAPELPENVRAAAQAAFARELARPTPRKHADAWWWVATYDDGTNVSEVDENLCSVHAMADVDVSRVIAFTLIPTRPESGLPCPTVELEPATGQRVIFTRRRSITIDPNGPGREVGRKTVHLLGWQRTVNGKNVKAVAYWFEDGSCLFSDNDQLCP